MGIELNNQFDNKLKQLMITYGFDLSLNGSLVLFELMKDKFLKSEFDFDLFNFFLNEISCLEIDTKTLDRDIRWCIKNLIDNKLTKSSFFESVNCVINSYFFN